MKPHGLSGKIDVSPSRRNNGELSPKNRNKSELVPDKLKSEERKPLEVA